MTGRLPMLAVTIGVAAALIATIVLEPIPLYIWNASASVPIGLYRLRPAHQFQVTELVAVQPPAPLATLLASTGHLPIGVPMLKRVLALPGQSVCRTGLTISVDEVAVIPLVNRAADKYAISTTLYDENIGVSDFEVGYWNIANWNRKA